MILFYDTDHTVDARKWRLFSQAGELKIDTVNDAEAAVMTNPLRITYAGDIIVQGSAYCGGATAAANRVALIGSANNFTADQVITKLRPALILNGSGGPQIRFAMTGNEFMDLTGNAYFDGTNWLPYYAPYHKLLFQFSMNSGTVGIYRGDPNVSPVIWQGLQTWDSAGKIRERNRGEFQGSWYNYTPSCFVDTFSIPADSALCKYMLIGGTCFWEIYVALTTYTTYGVIKVSVPRIMTAPHHHFQFVVRAYTATIGWENVYGHVSASSATVDFYRLNNAAWPTGQSQIYFACGHHPIDPIG